MPAVDRAAFAVALVERIRRAGLTIPMSRAETLVRALEACWPSDNDQIYWLTRIALIDDPRDFERFDRIFEAVFGNRTLALDPNARRRGQAGTTPDQSQHPAPLGSLDPAAEPRPADDSSLPWATPPAGSRKVTANDEDGAADDGDLLMADPQAAGAEQLADVPFDELDEHDLMALTKWLIDTQPGRPTRRTRRHRPSRTGSRVSIRRTLEHSRGTGFEPLRLWHDRPVRKPRRVLVACDVSRSMQAYVAAYLCGLRALALTTSAEIFAFATRLTRLTIALERSLTTAAIAEANELVSDRFGGTRIAGNLDALLRSHHGSRISGAVVLIISDGCDSDTPEELAAVMARLQRRAHKLIWVNPRLAAPSYQPLVGGFQAALPYCDRVFPGHTPRALGEVFRAI